MLLLNLFFFIITISTASSHLSHMARLNGSVSKKKLNHKKKSCVSVKRVTLYHLMWIIFTLK